MAVTTRFGATILTGTETPDIPRDFNQLAGRLEAVGALFAQGTLAARPAAAAANAGTFYRATDQGRTGIGIVYFSTGSAWVIPESYPRVITDVVSPGFAPVDGDIVHYHFVIGGSLSKDWELKYLAGRPSRKWEPIGAAPILGSATPGAPTAVSNPAGTVIASGIVTLPAPGRYLLRGSIPVAQWASGTPAQLTLALRANGAASPELTPRASTSLTAADNVRSLSVEAEAIVNAANTTVDLKIYAVGSANVGSAFDAYLCSAIPLELGT